MLKKKLEGTLWLLVILILLSIPGAMLVGKYQVCKNYFPEISSYACWFTQLPPYIGVKK